MKKSHLKTLVREIVTEVKKVRGEHRGAKGLNVGKTRSKHHPQGKSGEIAPRPGEAGSNIDKATIIKKYLGTTRKTDQLLDLADTLGVQIPTTISRFDDAEVASFLLNHLYSEDPKTHQEIPNQAFIDRAYDFLVGAGFINFKYLDKIRGAGEHGDEELEQEPGETSSPLEIDPENPPAPEPEEEPLPDQDFEEPSAEDDNEPTSRPEDQPQLSEAAQAKLKKLIRHLVNESFKNEDVAFAGAGSAEASYPPVRTENVIQNANLTTSEIESIKRKCELLDRSWKALVKHQNGKHSDDIVNHMYEILDSIEVAVRELKNKISSELK